MTSKDIQNYIEVDLGKHASRSEMLLEATQETASNLKLTSGVCSVHVADEPIGYSHSYGFHTSYGRAICDHFTLPFTNHESAQESKQELEAAIRYAENAISSAKRTIESMEFRQEMAKKQSS